MKYAPKVPVGVRVRLADDRVLNVECVYVGLVDDVHIWEVAYPIAGRPQVQVDVLPDQTVVVLHGARRTAR